MTADAARIHGDVEAARAGDLAALERVLRHAEQAVFGLAVRMLGDREDARDATQEILIRIATRLSEFRGDSAFLTWAYRIASNALIDTRRRRARARERTFSELASELDAGLETYDRLGGAEASPPTPEDESLAAEMALLCTQGMLQALDPAHRLAYILGEVFELGSELAAEIAEVSPAAFRQRLLRARGDLRAFMSRACGLVGADARCRCQAQVVALGGRGRAILASRPLSRGDAPLPSAEPAAHVGVTELLELSALARVFRAHPRYRADPAILSELRDRIAATVFGAGDPS